MKLVDVGTVAKVSDFVNKKGEIFYLVVVDGVNSAWLVYRRCNYKIG